MKEQPVGIYAVVMAAVAALWSVLAWAGVDVPQEVQTAVTALVVAVGGTFVWRRVSPVE